MTKEEIQIAQAAYCVGKMWDEYEGTEDFDLLVGKRVQHLIELVRKSNPSLPSNLDEAADKFAHFYDNGTCDGIAQECFKSGAEWMAGQGATIEDEVCELYDKLYLYYIDDCSSMTPDTSCGMLKELGASKGDKVVVQIRKL